MGQELDILRIRAEKYDRDPANLTLHNRILLLCKECEDRKRDDLLPAEVVALEKLLRGMLAYDPSKRMSLDAVMQSEWMQ